jgi:hypothetical protein
VKAIHEIGEAFEQLPAPTAALEQAEVEPRIEIQQEALQSRLPSRSIAGKTQL